MTGDETHRLHPPLPALSATWDLTLVLGKRSLPEQPGLAVNRIRTSVLKGRTHAQDFRLGQMWLVQTLTEVVLDPRGAHALDLSADEVIDAIREKLLGQESTRHLVPEHFEATAGRAMAAGAAGRGGGLLQQLDYARSGC